MASMISPGERRIGPNSKPWRARVKRKPFEYFLGTYHTREEAEAAEREFKARRSARSA